MLIPFNWVVWETLNDFTLGVGAIYTFSIYIYTYIYAYKLCRYIHMYVYIYIYYTYKCAYTVYIFYSILPFQLKNMYGFLWPPFFPWQGCPEGEQAPACCLSPPYIGTAIYVGHQGHAHPLNPIHFLCDWEVLCSNAWNGSQGIYFSTQNWFL